MPFKSFEQRYFAVFYLPKQLVTQRLSIKVRWIRVSLSCLFCFSLRTSKNHYSISKHTVLTGGILPPLASILRDDLPWTVLCQLVCTLIYIIRSSIFVYPSMNRTISCIRVARLLENSQDAFTRWTLTAHKKLHSNLICLWTSWLPPPNQAAIRNPLCSYLICSQKKVVSSHLC